MKNRIKEAFLSDKLVFGFKISDLLGIVIMIIPFIISIRFNHIIPGKRFWFVSISSDKSINIRPGLISAL